MGIDVRMFAVLPNEPTEQQINRWSYELAVCFPEYIWHNPSDKHRALYIQEHHNIETDKIVLELSTPMRYYGVGHERGPLPTIIMIAEWLERRLNAQVHYGGDNGYPIPFTKDERDKLFDHFVNKVGTTPYESGWHSKSAPICSFDNEPMWRTSSGPYERYVFECPACNQRRVIDNNPTEVQKTYESWVSK